MKEQEFYDVLKDLFIGTKIEGESGYANLMRIKSRYYEEEVFPKLRADIDKALEHCPEFKEELFDKLYDFFSKYFSESGSICFRQARDSQDIYERVYTDGRDIKLFWKTHMLYYVKTDRLFKSSEVEVDGIRFFFDTSTAEYKRANEKRTIVYELKGQREDGVIVFNVIYTEKEQVTKIDDILKRLREDGATISESTLKKAFRKFERQCKEVDYFINKNAREFLQEQFKLWFYQHIFSSEFEWAKKE